MFLCVDIGNSSITVGMFEDGNLVKASSFGYQKKFSKYIIENILSGILKDEIISGCAVASVSGEMTPLVCENIEQICDVIPLEITNDMNLGFKIKAKKPELVGIDRIANISAVCKMYSEPVIVVDFGTATTFDIKDAKQNFIGGLIMPGIGTQLKSLADNTSRLPNVDFKEYEQVKKVINTDTKKSMLTGVVKGHVHAVEGLLEDCIKELKTKPVIIATGGYAEFISKFEKLSKFDSVDRHLTIRGIREIYKLNSD